jgi:hypothetical protein
MPAYTPQDPAVTWRKYLDTLHWAKGSLDDSSNRLFLRAASLKIPEQDAFDEVVRRIIDAGDQPRIAKLQRQLASAYARAGGGAASSVNGIYRSFYSPAAKFPDPDLDLIRQVTTIGPGLYDLWEKSPVRWDDGECHAQEIIEALFPGNPLLCIGTSSNAFGTNTRQAWGNRVSNCSLIVPNPMLAKLGKTQDGKASAHSLEATGRRVYQIIEFDFRADHPLTTEWTAAGFTVADACAALHLHLARLQTLACVTSSGGKSLHGWYQVHGLSELAQRAFMADAVRLGADSKLWSRCQFTRIPDGKRENGERQTAFYLNPKATLSSL